ncbi:hypothetical protein Q9314_24640 (plasmid) [Shinella sumterensis]|nr:hypothetical protein Q9314_24640 [Shinella sumterensis]
MMNNTLIGGLLNNDKPVSLLLQAFGWILSDAAVELGIRPSSRPAFIFGDR